MRMGDICTEFAALANKSAEASRRLLSKLPWSCMMCISHSSTSPVHNGIPENCDCLIFCKDKTNGLSATKQLCHLLMWWSQGDTAPAAAGKQIAVCWRGRMLWRPTSRHHYEAQTPAACATSRGSGPQQALTLQKRLSDLSPWLKYIPFPAFPLNNFSLQWLVQMQQ